jgi:hypothetical protein
MSDHAAPERSNSCQAVAGSALLTAARGQSDLRIQVSCRDTHGGRRRMQLRLGGEDIRAAMNEFRRQTDRQLAR